jgi:hypothetical protein
MEYPLHPYVKHFGVNFDKQITWRLQIEMTESKAFRTFIKIYFLFKSERLSDIVALV